MKKTSLEAYENMKPKIPNDQEKILSVLSETKEMTYNEIASVLGWTNPNKVSRRLPELLRLEKIKSGDIRLCTIAKSKCNTYILNA